MEWKPITEMQLRKEISAAEGRMDPRMFRLWKAIKITPRKWSEETYGAIGGGFWAVAVVGGKVIWYNDIEDGFNCSTYRVAGRIAEYFCNQDTLEQALQNVLSVIETGEDRAMRRGPPVFETDCM